jgi:hypothetical protein
MVVLAGCLVEDIRWARFLEAGFGGNFGARVGARRRDRDAARGGGSRVGLGDCRSLFLMVGLGLGSA